MVLTHFLQAAAHLGFAVHAYVFMPDHVHLLVEGVREDSDLREFVKSAKQRSGYGYSQRERRRLWQPSYVDRVLRDEESTPDVVAYIVANPLRAGLASNFGEYEFAGSQTLSMDALGELVSARGNGRARARQA